MRLRGYYIGFAWGAAAYELQVHRFGVRVVHLRGHYWRWKPWRRVSFHWHSKEQA